MKRILVWDLPTRLFHWLLAGAFTGAFVLANVDDDGPLFPIHMLLGLVMAFMVVLRVVWGFVGTRHARFGAFVFGPGAVVAYVKGVISGDGERHVGHNPGAAVAIFAMLALSLGLAVTGVLMGGGSEAAEEVHEVLAYLLLATVLLHVAGVIVHTLRHRENLALSMVDGHKEGPEGQAIRSSRPLVALAFLVLTGLWSWRLAAGYDPAGQRLTVPVIGTTLQLGEAEHEHEHEHEHDGRREHERRDD